MTPKQVAAVVCHVMSGATPEAIMADHRGSARTAELRAVSMLMWRHVNNWPCLTATGEAFGRDRRNVARGLQRIEKKGVPTEREMTHMLALLDQD